GPNLPPDDPNSVLVLVQTEPAGARVVFVPLHPDTGEPEAERAVQPSPEQRTPLEIKLAPGPYFVEAALGDGRFHQVFRQVPLTGQRLTTGFFPHRGWTVRDDGTVELPTIQIPGADVTTRMARFEGSRNFLMGSDELAEARPPHVQPVA